MRCAIQVLRRRVWAKDAQVAMAPIDYVEVNDALEHELSDIFNDRPIYCKHCLSLTNLFNKIFSHLAHCIRSSDPQITIDVVKVGYPHAPPKTLRV